MEKADILEALPCGCMVFGQDGTINFVNSSLCKMAEYDGGQLLGKHFEMLLTVSSRIFYQTHLFPLLTLQGEVNEIFLTLKSKTGRAIPVMVNAKRADFNGETGYVCVLATVFERQKYEQQLLAARNAQQKAAQENEQLNRLKIDLEFNQHQLDRKVSILNERNQQYIQMGKVLMHDMQEPIRKIIFFFEALFSKQPDKNDEDLKKQMIIQKSVLRLRSLTSSLLDFVDINTSKEAFTLLSADELLQQASARVINELHSPDFEIQIGQIPKFEGKLSLIKRVFEEVLKNAVQNSSPDNKLKITVKAVIIQENIFLVHADKYKYTDHIKIEISDNGAGFDSQYESYVFGLLNKISTASQGVGLGLAICKQIISHHYGTIRIRSQTGQGTRVIIVLPVNQSQEG